MCALAAGLHNPRVFGGSNHSPGEGSGFLAAAAAVDLCSVLLLDIAAAGWWVGVRGKDCCC